MGLFTGRNDQAQTGTTGTGPRFTHNNEPAPTSTGVGHRYPTRSHGPLSGPGTTTAGTNAVGDNSGGGLFNRNRGSGTVAPGPTTNSRYNDAGTTVGRTPGGAHSAAIGDSGAQTQVGQTNTNTPTQGHGSAKSAAGVVQRGLGKALNSRSMQMKGDAKIQQGEAEKVAAQHLRDADRLEGEAAAKRNLAGVAPGIHSTGANARGNMLH